MDLQEKELTNLLNPAFTFRFADKEYQIKKANITQIQQYSTRIDELTKNTAMNLQIRDLEAVSYAVFLILNASDSTVTEDFIKNNLTIKVDGLSLLGLLGFIDPQKVEILKKMQEKLLSGESLSKLLPGQDGLQKKSEG